MRAGLKTIGFGRVYRYAQSLTASVPMRDAPRRADISAIVWAVAMAAAFYPGRALCLERSLTLYYLLRRAGISATLRLGVQPHPFAAHAWVEREGVPLNDVLEHTSHFAALPELPT
jgi:hypothetical protein